MASHLHHVAVVGGGVAGLATAFFILQNRPDVRISVFEKEREAGGKVRSSLQEGYTVDLAPNGFLTNVPDTLDLARALGLEGELQEASEVAKHRFLYTRGALKRLPTSPPALLRIDLLLPSEKLRAALEPLLAKPNDGEETVFDFVARHFGRGAAETFAGPFVLGITAGDAKRLSLDALFPRFRALEREHGSLLKGLLRQQREARAAGRKPGRQTSFKGEGGARLVRALREALGARVCVGGSVTSLEPRAGGYMVGLESGERVEASHVVLATPAFVSADLVAPFAPEAAAPLRSIPYADVQVFGLGFHRVDVPDALDGFGFLVPRGEGVRSLGVLYSSSIFPDQAPEGRVLLRVIAGGSVDPEFAALSADEALEAVQRDLRVTLGVTAEPEFVVHAPWPKGIPQYELGHRERVRAAEEALAAHPGLHLTGNAYRGVGLNDTVRDARRVAEAVSRDLA